MESQYAHMIANLVAVLGLMVLAMYLLKKFKVSRYAGNKQIDIINIVPVGTKEKIILMRVNEAVLLVGATPNHIETLHVFTESEKRQMEKVEDKKTFAVQLAELKK